MQKWEYLIIEVSISLDSSRKIVSARINELGRDGWELVSATSDKSGHCVNLFLKRPLGQK
jgi:hypothetical protein